METTMNEVNKRTIAFSAAFGLKNHYADLGVEVSLEQARKELRKRLENADPPEPQFWIEHPELQRREGYEYFLSHEGFWPCLLSVDTQNGAVKECQKVGLWLDPVATDHATLRFRKHSAKVGRYYTDEDSARMDLLRRLMSSRRIDPAELRNGEERLSRYVDSLYSLEETVGTKVPLVFAIRQAVKNRRRPVLLAVTCFPFKGTGASRHKPKDRHGRARHKMLLQRLMKEPFLDEEN